MKKTAWIAALLLTVILTGCGQQTPPTASSSAASSEGESVTMDDLAVELPRDLDTDAARAAMVLLPQYLAEDGVEVQQISLTFGTSYAATAAALDSGAVQLAFLPAMDFAHECTASVPLLADARQTLRVDSTAIAEWNTGKAMGTVDSWTAGTFALLCAAPTEYGKNLADRAEAGKSLSWTELNNAHWGVLHTDSVGGYQCADLWLEDNYEDNQVTDLDNVTVYESWEDLLRAAANGDIDLFPLLPELRDTYTETWTTDVGKTSVGGVQGFGRADSIQKEVRVIGVSERLYTFVAAAASDSAVNSEAFRTALADALEQVFSDPSVRLAAIGAEHYAPVQPDDLDGLRRLTMG